MSTRSTELAQPIVDPRSLPWRPFVYAFLLTVGAVVVFAVAFALAIVGFNANKIVPGTVVAGVPLGGLDRASAEVRLREQLPSLSSGHISVKFGDKESQIPYSAFGRDYDLKAMLDQAFAQGRGGSVFDDAQAQLRISINGASVQPKVTWDEAKLEAQLNALAAAAETAPVDASIYRQAGNFVVKPSAPGTHVDANSAWQQAITTVSSLSAADTTVSVEPVMKPPAVTTEMAQIAVDRADRVAASDLNLTSPGINETITADTIRGWISLDPAGAGQWNVVLQQAPVTQAVAQISAAVYKAPTDASFKWDGGAATAVPGTSGRQLDVSTTSQAVYDALIGRADGPPVSTVQLSIVTIDPDFTTAEAIALAPKVKLLSSWTTGFTPSERNFNGANIVLPALKINGTVVPAGELFSFWGTVGSLTDLPGIGPGGVIKHGHTFPQGALGGGICSCSTTLWNAAMRAGLQIGARQNHDYFINRYPTGLDATVWKTSRASQDMTFTNNTDYPIIIRGIKGVSTTDCAGLKVEFGKVGYANCVVFEIWGIPTGRTVSYTKPVITNVQPATDVMEYEDTDLDGNPLAPGQQLRIEYPTDAFWSTVVRTVRDANGNIIEQNTISSKYVLVTGVTLVGRAPTDPPAGTQFPNPKPWPNFYPPETPPGTPV